MSIRKLRDPRLTEQGISGTNVLQQSPMQEDQDTMAPQETMIPEVNTSAPAQTQPAPKTNIPSQTPKTSPRSGMFTNIKSYIEKNQPASQKLAKTVGGTVQRSADIARKNIQATEQQFRNLMEKGSLADRKGAVGEVRSAAEAAASMKAPVRPVKPSLEFGTEVDGKYYVGRGSSSRLSDLISGNFDSGRRLHTSDIKDMWLDKDQFDAYQSWRDSQPVRDDRVKMPDADKRLKQILDATYQGPQRLYQIGSYGQSARKAEEAERLRQQLTSGRGSTELLRKSLERPGTKYTEGSRKLDQLLFGSSKPQEELQKLKENIGDVSQDIQQAGELAQREALARGREISDIRTEARRALQSQAESRAKEVEDYITSQVQAGGELADYYTNLLSQAGEEGLDLGSIEARTLGVKSGAGIFNLLTDPDQRKDVLKAIDTRENLERARLLSKDQQAQLAELERLARLSKEFGVEGSGLGFKSEYQDASLAETQDALAALGLEQFGKKLTEAEKEFRKQAEQDITGVGKGKSKYQKGLFRGRGTVKSTATETANLKNILKDQGYDFESDPSTYTTDANVDILKNIAKLSKGEAIADQGIDALSAQELGEIVALGDPNLARIITRGAGAGIVPSLVKDVGSALEDARILGDIGETFGKGLKDIGTEAEAALDNIFGSGKSKAKKEAKAKAKKAAMKDLQKRLKEAFEESGVQKRIKVADTEETKLRQKQLADILKGIDIR